MLDHIHVCFGSIMCQALQVQHITWTEWWLSHLPPSHKVSTLRQMFTLLFGLRTVPMTFTCFFAVKPKQDRKGFKSSVPVLISTKKDVMANRKKFRDATSLIFKTSYDLYAPVIQSVLCSRKRHPQRTQKETVLISQMCIIIKWLTLPAATLFQCSCSFGKPAVTCSLLSLLWGWCSKWDYWELLIPGLATFFVHLIDKAHWAFLHQLLSGMQDVISGAPESFS